MANLMLEILNVFFLRYEFWCRPTGVQSPRFFKWLWILNWSKWTLPKRNRLRQTDCFRKIGNAMKVKRVSNIWVRMSILILIYSNSKFKVTYDKVKRGPWIPVHQNSYQKGTVQNFYNYIRHFAFLSEKILKLNPEYFGVYYSWYHQIRFKMVHFNIKNAKSRVC